KEEAETTTSRAQHLDQFEAMMRDNGLDDRTIEARMFAERANAKPARDAVTYRPNTSKKPGRRSAPGLGAQRDVDCGRLFSSVMFFSPRAASGGCSYGG